MIANEFDSDRDAIINPGDLIKKIDGFPKKCIGVFSDTILEKILEEYEHEVLDELKSCNGPIPIYKICHEGKEYGIFLACVGGPMICGQLEEFGAMGAEAFVLFGSCGVLDSSINHGNIILPYAAVRDEGVSYHYLEPSDEVHLDENCVKTAEHVLKEMGYPFVMGKTWTTDCFYRETKKKMEKRRSQGCIAVEMECASAAAVALFRGYRFAQFLFAADNLDSEVWDQRNLSDKGIKGYDVYMEAAFKIADGLLF